MRRRVFVALSLFVCAFSAQAQVSVPASSSVQLSGGTLDLGGTDLQIGGTLGLGSGAIANARNVSTLSGGSLNAGSGSVTLFGNWSGLGSFAAGSGSVNWHMT